MKLKNYYSILAFVIAGLVVAGGWLLWRNLHGVENAYAVWHVADW